MKEVEIWRSSRNGHYNQLWITIKNISNGVNFTEMKSFTEHHNEYEAVIILLDDLAQGLYEFDIQSLIPISEEFRVKIIEGFRQLQENDLNGNNVGSMKMLEPHFSCKKNKNEDTANEASKEISQSELQQKLATVGKDNKVMKFFEDNKCCVCLSSYKEALDDNHHIVIPSCGHPLCCECADNILASTKKECPRCRGNITADSFNLMKFNGDLQMVTEDVRVFL